MPLVAQLDHQVLNEIEGLANPTSELLAVWCWQRLAPALPGLVEVVVSRDPDVALRVPWRSEPARHHAELLGHRAAARSPARARGPPAARARARRRVPAGGAAARRRRATTADVLADGARHARALREGVRRGTTATARHAEGGPGGPRDPSRAPLLETRALALPEPRTGRRAPAAVGARRDRRRSGLGPHDAPPLSARRRRRAREASPRDRRGDPRARPRQHSAPQILCGDFNATPDSDEMRFLRGLTTLGGRRTHFQDAWLRLHREPGPATARARASRGRARTS